MNFSKARAQFPFLTSKKEQKLIYFDNAATTQKPQSVIDALIDFYVSTNASVHRGIYERSEHATILYEGVRDKVTNFVGATDRSEIIFTSGATEGINFIADTWGAANLKPGDEIVLTQVEHHANLLPWQRLAKRTGAKLKFIKFNTKTFLLESPEENFFSSKTKLVAITHSSNVFGHVWPERSLESIIEHAHAVGAKVLLDSAQSVPHEYLDLQKLNPDFCVFSGHKMFAPTGVGVLFIKKDLHDEIEPYRVGGSMVHEASLNDAVWKRAPHKFEAGTPPIAQVVGLGAAIDFFNEHVNFAALQKHEAELCEAAIKGLYEITGVRTYPSIHSLSLKASESTRDERQVSARLSSSKPFVSSDHVEAKSEDGSYRELPNGTSSHLFSFTVDGIHAHDIAAMLSEHGIAVRAGHHCAQPLAKLLGLNASVRVSFSLYNTPEEVEIFVQKLKQILKKFRS